jgi:hypothetical protein
LLMGFLKWTENRWIALCCGCIVLSSKCWKLT